MRSTRSHTGNRRSHHKLTAAAASACPECGATKAAHRVCMNCGKYNGRQVLNVHKKIEKKAKKAKAAKAA